MLHLLVFLFYALLSIVVLRRFLPVWNVAIPGGMEDTRLCLWNAWWFRHAIHTLHVNPFYTRLLFYPSGISLVGNDSPLWNDLVTYVAQAAGLNLIAACNLCFIVSWVLAGFCTYLLVWDVVRSRGPAIVAGVFVMTHSFTLARMMQNWSYINIFGIALFLWMLRRARRLGRTRDYVASGVALAWTAACHYYFLIYCGVIWIASIAYDLSPWRIRLERRVVSHPSGRYFLVLALLSGSLAGWILFLHPKSFTLGHLYIGMETPSNALFVMWLVLFAWVFSGFRVVVSTRSDPQAVSPSDRRRRLIKESISAVTALVCLSPLIWGTIQLAWHGEYPRQGVLWKTPLPGANLLSPLMPNPLHAWWGPAISQWYMGRGIQPQEEAASLGWLCLAIILWSRVWRQGRSTRRWIALAIAATVMSMGVYLHILEWNFWMPLPFYVWRLIPIFGNVRVPERWMAVGAIAWGVVLALAIVRLARNKGWRLNRVCFVVGAAILLENWPGIPLGQPPENLPVYQTLHSLPAGGVLTLPFALRDSAIGAGAGLPMGWNIPWDDLGVQIYHQQPILGGCIGRISRKLVNKYRTDPFLGSLLQLEEGAPAVKPMNPAEACKSMQDFGVSYILLYPQATPPSALNFVTQSLPIQRMGSSGRIELYRLNCS